MKIAGAELLEIRLDLKEPFSSSESSRSERRILLLRVFADGASFDDGDGRTSLDDRVVGWGECVAGEDPSYSYETTDTAWAILTTILLPTLPGREIEGPAEILEPVRWVQGHPMAKAAMEMAVWDLVAKDQGVPLWELLGGSGESVEVGVSLGLDHDRRSLVESVESFLSRGYARIKLKVEPGWDVEPVRAVRDRFPDAALAVDANGAYGRDSRALDELDELGLVMIEQPLPADDLLGLAAVQSRLRTPISLDESVGSLSQARAALELGSGRILNLKPGRVGGFGEARAILGHCRTAGVPVWCGGMLESGVGRAHSLALATLEGFTLPGDLSESRRYWDRDIVNPEFEMVDGRMAPAAGAGIGVVPELARVRELTVRSSTFGSVR